MLSVRRDDTELFWARVLAVDMEGKDEHPGAGLLFVSFTQSHVRELLKFSRRIFALDGVRASAVSRLSKEAEGVFGVVMFKSLDASFHIGEGAR